MSQVYPQTLTSLSPREAIADALYRATIGIDRYDASIFNSAWAGEDVSFSITGREPENGLANIQKNVFDVVGPMDTLHMLSNLRVNVADGANTASLTCNALAQHCPPGRGKEPAGPKFLAGGEYWVDLIKDESNGLWKIKKWALDLIWAEGDPTVMAPPK